MPQCCTSDSSPGFGPGPLGARDATPFAAGIGREGSDIFTRRRAGDEKDGEEGDGRHSAEEIRGRRDIRHTSDRWGTTASGPLHPINTAFVERQNLTLRMLTRRFNRLTNAHSKSLRNHRAAMDLYVGYYNLCWQHETLKKTPAMAAGVVNEQWDVAKLIYECKLAGKPWEPPHRSGSEKYAEYLKDRQKEKKK
jgi:hypothetical protein